MNARVVNYLNKSLSSHQSCDLTYDTIVSHPEINQIHLQQGMLYASFRDIGMVGLQAENWLDEGENGTLL